MAASTDPLPAPPTPVGPSTDVQVRTLRGSEPQPAPRTDRVAVEAPLEIRFGGRAATVLMRTPGDDDELVRGFLYSEGMIQQASDLVAMSRPPDLRGDEAGNVIAVELAPGRAVTSGSPLDRMFYGSSSCGVCGKNSIASLAVKAVPSTSDLRVRRDVLGALPARLREAQATFRETGGLHASGLFTPGGALAVVREDVGRHNALDKVIGWALAAGALPLDGHLLLVSGRVSYEIVQKAAVAGLPLIAAVGAPSSLAVDLAVQFNLTLVGFLRPDTMNVYAGSERVVLTES